MYDHVEDHEQRGAAFLITDYFASPAHRLVVADAELPKQSGETITGCDPEKLHAEPAEEVAAGEVFEVHLDREEELVGEGRELSERPAGRAGMISSGKTWPLRKYSKE